MTVGAEGRMCLVDHLDEELDRKILKTTGGLTLCDNNETIHRAFNPDLTFIISGHRLQVVILFVPCCNYLTALLYTSLHCLLTLLVK